MRGDKDWGNERNMARCEQEGLPYMFKQRMTKGVRRVVEKAIALFYNWWSLFARLADPEHQAAPTG